MAPFENYLKHGGQSISPGSSSGSNRSLGGTPESKNTDFLSPEPKSASGKPSTLKQTTSSSQDEPSDDLNDVFIDNVNNKGKCGLSATAHAFQPYAIPHAPASAAGPSPSLPVKQASTIVDPITFLTNSLLATSKTTKIGIFTTDTRSSRFLKMVSILGAQVKLLVDASLEKLRQGGWSPKGSFRTGEANDALYVRLSNIGDAQHFCQAVKVDHPANLEVTYVEAAEWATRFSPVPGVMNNFEGQVILGVLYPALENFNRDAFQDEVRQLLVAEGPLCAWENLSKEGSDQFTLRAEFYDASFASRAVKRLAGLPLPSRTPSCVFLQVEHYIPEKAVTPQPKGPEMTPTRRPGSSGLQDAFLSMSLNSKTSSSTRDNMAYSPSAIPPHGMANLAYISTNGGIPLAQGSVPVVLNGGYPQTPIGAALQQPMMAALHAQAQLGVNNMVALYSQGVYPYGLDQSSMSPIGYPHHSPHSEIGYSPVSPGSSRDLVPFRPGRRQNAVKVHPGSRRHQPNPASGQHNHVDIKKIQEGGDVRTTVMLRNIPNKVDQAMLKSIVDESSFGRYDFMYLRIDFSNNCNVGYAFINFVDPLDIINFVLARSNQKWHRFKSDKVAEVSYATIQGRDCLIQKFRNSSVMLEPPHYRPKLFFTVHDPYGRTGQEDQFPASDNASKLKRSCENAEHVGLFAPSAGQHLRDEQRRRRSQYDRGTSLAEREEYAYEVYNGYEVPQAIYPFRGPY